MLSYLEKVIVLTDYLQHGLIIEKGAPQKTLGKYKLIGPGTEPA
jgi:hypothetical protein